MEPQLTPSQKEEASRIATEWINKNTSPQKLTLSQMEEASRIATAEGMREIAEAMAKKKPNIEDYDMSENESNTSSSDDNINIIRKSKKNKNKIKSNTNMIIEKLESQIHYLRLDLANSKVATDDARFEANKYKNMNDIYMKVNNEFGFIRSAIDRSKKNLADLTIKQYKNKVALFVEEANEHVMLCERNIDMINLHEVKFAFERILLSEKKKIDKYTNELSNDIWWIETKSIAIKYLTIIFTFLIFFCFMIIIKFY